MENRAHALAAGLFVVLLCLGVVAVAIWLGGDRVQRDRYLLVSKIAPSGLNPKAVVRLRGVDVGKVEAIQFDPKDPRAILITIAVDSGAPVTKGTYAQFGFVGLTGLSFVQLGDDGSNPQRLETRDDALGRIDVRPSLLDQVGTSGQELLADASKAAKRIDALLSEENVAQLVRTLANLDAASGHIVALVNELQPGVKALSALATRAGLSLQRADPLIANLNGLTTDLRKRTDVLERVGRGADSVGQASHALEDELVNRALPKLYGAIDDLSRSSRAFEQVLSDVHDNPQSLIFGKRPAAPGPGEPGFRSFQSRR